MPGLTNHPSVSDLEPAELCANSTTPHARFLVKGKFCLGVWMVWTLMGLVFSFQHYSFQQVVYSEWQLGLVEILIWLMRQWYVWALLTFPVLFLASRFPLEKPHLARNIAIHCFGCVLIALLHITVDAILQSWLGPETVIEVPYPAGVLVLISKKLHIDLFIYWAMVVGYHGYLFFWRSRLRELETSRLQTRLVVAQLEALKSKLHPHFLFNTLNAIGGLMYRDLAAADRMLVKLSEFLRLTLQLPEGQMTTLGDEMAMVDAYLEIERARFGERLQIERDWDPCLADAELPVMVLLPIVENAIHHGIEKKVGDGFLRIKAWKEHDCLKLEVLDNGPGPGGKEGNGIGLSATRARLFHLYGDHLHLTLNHQPGGTAAQLVIPFRMLQKEDV